MVGFLRFVVGQAEFVRTDAESFAGVVEARILQLQTMVMKPLLRISIVGVGLCGGLVLQGAAADQGPPVSFLGALSREARATLDTGTAVMEVLPTHDGDLAVFGAAKVAAPRGRVVSWMRQIERLQTGRHPSIGRRFSDPPVMEDLEGLTLDDTDLEDLARCHPGNCGLKLSAVEIQQIRQLISKKRTDWKPAVQVAFRQLVLMRAVRYLAEGDAGAAPYHDHKRPVQLQLEFARVAGVMGGGDLYSPYADRYLRHYPKVSDSGVESYLYWSKGVLGSGKPIVSITHASIFTGKGRSPGVAAVVALKQVFANHYLTGSLSLTAIPEEPDGGSWCLLYLRRSRVDVLESSFGSLVRRLAENRIRAEGAGLLDGMRRHFESGEPPVISSK